MKKLIATSAMLWATSAFAADLPVKYSSTTPAYSWTGLYVEGFGFYGVNFGGATSTDLIGAGIATDLASMPNGPGFGGGFGYLLQQGGVVFGLRGEISYANLTANATGTVLNGASLSLGNATNYLGDLNGIVGLPLSGDGRLLGYATGGFAFGGAKPNLAVFAGPNAIAAAASDTSTGWDFGLGLKYALTPNWVVGIEGDYYRLGDRQLTATFGGVPIITSNAKYDIFTQRLAIGYKF